MVQATQRSHRTTMENMPTRMAILTYNIHPDGTVDWVYRIPASVVIIRIVMCCHGPNGDGSSYAPALANSLKTLSYADFVNIVTNGRKQTSTKPTIKSCSSFASNVNVMGYLDDIYVYLRARSNNSHPWVAARPRGEDKSDAEKAAGSPVATGRHQMISWARGDSETERSRKFWRLAAAIAIIDANPRSCVLARWRLPLRLCLGSLCTSNRSMPARSNSSTRSTSRACGDPRDPPFSNDKGEGFENKLCRAFRGEAQQESQLHLLSASDGLCQNDARFAPLRRHHGISARR